MSENVEEAHQIEDVGKCWGCSPRIIEHMAEAHWRTPPSILGLQWGWCQGWASLRHVFALPKNPIKRPWEDPKTGAKGVSLGRMLRK